jgi:tRNA 2-thiouridine synthesizing protein A
LNPRDQPRLLDCTGLYCPMPIIKVREALNQLRNGEILEVLADDPAAEEDIPNLIRRLRQQLIKVEKGGDGVTRFLIKRVR